MSSVEYQNQFAHFDTMTLVELIQAMDAVQRQKDALDAQLKEINKVFDFLRITKIPAKMDEDGIARLAVNGVGRVSLTADMHVSIKAEHKVDFYQWLADNGRGDLVQASVNPSTLKATVKSMFKNGEEIPETFLNVSPFTRASITRSA